MEARLCQGRFWRLSLAGKRMAVPVKDDPIAPFWSSSIFQKRPRLPSACKPTHSGPVKILHRPPSTFLCLFPALLCFEHNQTVHQDLLATAALSVCGGFSTRLLPTAIRTSICLTTTTPFSHHTTYSSYTLRLRDVPQCERPGPRYRLWISLFNFTQAWTCGEIPAAV